jgi:hypothetical protein
MESNKDKQVSHSVFLPAVVCRYGNFAVIVFLALYFFLLPFCLMIYYLTDLALKQEQIPRLAFRLHRSLSPKYEKWARQRVVQGNVGEIPLEDIAGTEWPLFGSVFYLLVEESLQQAWEQGRYTTSIPPNVYAKGAIEAAAALVTDPGHAAWVKQHWGENYLHRENVFYRMLLISALTSYQKLLGDEKYMPLLQEQVETLSKELDESPLGLLDDYPEQCYPTDVVAAIAAIRRADQVLGTDHSDFVKRSLRAFQGKLLDTTGLPPYMADARTGYIDISRGCSSQWITVWVPQLWPDKAKQFYDSFEKHFWQRRWGAVGFREFAREASMPGWYMDVDSGPVIAGFGASATAFGLGAARVNGRFDHAFPLGAELIAASWLLPCGTLFIPRLLSNATDAPYLGEAGVLFVLTRVPPEGTAVTKGDYLPPLVFCFLALYFGCGLLLILVSLYSFRRWKKRIAKDRLPYGNIQVAIWISLVLAGVIVCLTYELRFGLLLILLAQLLPQGETTVKLQEKQ